MEREEGLTERRGLAERRVGSEIEGVDGEIVLVLFAALGRSRREEVGGEVNVDGMFEGLQGSLRSHLLLLCLLYLCLSFLFFPLHLLHLLFQRDVLAVEEVALPSPPLCFPFIVSDVHQRKIMYKKSLKNQ